MITIDFAHSTGAKTQILSKKELSRIIDSAYVKSLCEEIAAETDDKRRSALKKKLAVFLWHAHFPSGHRVNADAEPSGLIMLDLDHVENPRDLFEQINERAINEFGLVAAHVSCSGTGLRLVFPVPEGMTLAQAMKYYERVLSLPNVDKACKDYARSSYVVPRDYFLYIDEEVLFGDKELMKVVPKPEELALLEEKSKVKRSKSKDKGQKSKDKGQKAEVKVEDVDGIPLKTIVEALEKVLCSSPSCGKPKVGNRNNFYFMMVANIIKICQNRDVLLQTIPDYGLDEEERKRILSSSTLENCKEGDSVLLNRAIKLARDVVEDEKEDLPPAMPEELPDLLRLLVSKTPKQCRAAVANAVFAGLSTYLNKVLFRLPSNESVEPKILAILIAHTRSGKSAVNKPLDYILSRIRKNDAIARQKFDEWAKECRKRSSAKDKPQRPDVYWQEVSADSTMPALLDRLIQANGHYLFMRMNELDDLRSLGNSLNNTAYVGKLLRKAFDNDMQSAERKSAEGMTGMAEMRLNLAASTTENQAVKFFDNRFSYSDGTIARLSTATIVKNENEEFVYGDYDEEYAKALQPYIDRLCATHDQTVECPEAFAICKELTREWEKKVSLTQDEVLGDLIHTAITIAYFKAMILFIAEGGWSEKIEKIFRWTVEYDLWVKQHFFGAKLAQAQKGIYTQPHRGKQNLLEQLPETFTLDQARDVRMKNGLDGRVKQQIANWVFRRFIRKDENGSYTKLAS